MYRSYIKRLLDIVLSLASLVVLSPLLLIVALLVRVKIGSPVLFSQSRSGKGGKPFNLLKFRSMTEERDCHGVYLPDEMRITPFGSLIRKTSIDELPSLVNILKGDMSVIGPRPLPIRYLERYSDEQRRRLEVRPGLSNVAVTNGRNLQSWEEQFVQDVWYVDNMSFSVDAKSILDTIKIVLSREGSVAEDGGSRCEFIGTADPDKLYDPDGNFMKIRSASVEKDGKGISR